MRELQVHTRKQKHENAFEIMDDYDSSSGSGGGEAKEKRKKIKFSEAIVVVG